MKLTSVIRYCAFFDLIVTALFAIPVVAGVTLNILVALNNVFLPQYFLPEIPPIGWLFIYLMGGLGVIWALGRIIQPSARLARIDAVARLWVAGIFIYCLSGSELPQILWFFVFTEVLGSLWQFRTLGRNRGLVNPY